MVYTIMWNFAQKPILRSTLIGAQAVNDRFTSRAIICRC